MFKKIISYIIAFALVIALLSSIVITIISNTILTQSYTLSILEKNEYYEKMYNEIMENFKNNTIQSGLEETVLEGIIEKEQVKKDVEALVEYIYTEKELNINDEIVKTRLQENINKVIEQNNKRVTSEEQNQIDIYVNTIAKIYKNGIVYSEQYVKEIANTAVKAQNLVKKVQPIVYVATAVLAIVLLIINKFESLKYIGIASISTGILLLSAYIIKEIETNVQNILILNQTFSNILIDLIEQIMQKFLIWGIIFSIFGILISIFGRNKNNEKNSKH